MSYFPSGFWPRLITRLLGDNTIYNLVLELYNLPDELKSNKHFMRTQGNCPEWKCWQVCLMEMMWLSMSGHTKESYMFNDTVKATFTLSNRDYFASWSNLCQTTNKIIAMSQSQTHTLGVKEP